MLRYLATIRSTVRLVRTVIGPSVASIKAKSSSDSDMYPHGNQRARASDGNVDSHHLFIAS